MSRYSGGQQNEEVTGKASGYLIRKRDDLVGTFLKQSLGARVPPVVPVVPVVPVLPVVPVVPPGEEVAPEGSFARLPSNRINILRAI